MFSWRGCVPGSSGTRGDRWGEGGSHTECCYCFSRGGCVLCFVCRLLLMMALPPVLQCSRRCMRQSVQPHCHVARRRRNHTGAAHTRKSKFTSKADPPTHRLIIKMARIDGEASPSSPCAPIPVSCLIASFFPCSAASRFHLQPRPQYPGVWLPRGAAYKRARGHQRRIVAGIHPLLPSHRVFCTTPPLLYSSSPHLPT